MGCIVQKSFGSYYKCFSTLGIMMQNHCSSGLLTKTNNHNSPSTESLTRALYIFHLTKYHSSVQNHYVNFMILIACIIIYAKQNEVDNISIQLGNCIIGILTTVNLHLLCFQDSMQFCYKKLYVLSICC